MSEMETPTPADVTAEPAPPPAPQRKSRARRILRGLFYLAVVSLLLAIVAAVGIYLAYDYITRPGIAGPEVTVTIPEGATGYQAGRILAENGLVEHELFVRAAIKLDKRPLIVKHGTYVLNRGLSPTQLLDKLREGPKPSAVDQNKVTVPEGLSIAQAAQLFEDPIAFQEAAADPALIAELGFDVPSLEGFLMPNTYFFEKKPTEREVVERMVKQFQEEWEKLVSSIPDAAGQDPLKIVTIASLVEEEAKVDEERPLVAAVIYNRVEQNIPLGLDATLQFALNKYGQRMLDKDKEVDSPYNTYLHVGLPPGPICSPGIKSMRAALQPAEEDYLYFVSNADGRTHTFSKTLTEHNQAVAKFRREIAVQRREQRQQAQ